MNHTQKDKLRKLIEIVKANPDIDTDSIIDFYVMMDSGSEQNADVKPKNSKKNRGPIKRYTKFEKKELHDMVRHFGEPSRVPDKVVMQTAEKMNRTTDAIVTQLYYRHWDILKENKTNESEGEKNENGTDRDNHQ